jgi:hypothetical protein
MGGPRRRSAQHAKQPECVLIRPAAQRIAVEVAAGVSPETRESGRKKQNPPGRVNRADSSEVRPAALHNAPSGDCARILAMSPHRAPIQGGGPLQPTTAPEKRPSNANRLDVMGPLGLFPPRATQHTSHTHERRRYVPWQRLERNAAASSSFVCTYSMPDGDIGGTKFRLKPCHVVSKNVGAGPQRYRRRPARTSSHSGSEIRGRAPWLRPQKCP